MTRQLSVSLRRSLVELSLSDSTRKADTMFVKTSKYFDLPHFLLSPNKYTDDQKKRRLTFMTDLSTHKNVTDSIVIHIDEHINCASGKENEIRICFVF